MKRWCIPLLAALCACGERGPTAEALFAEAVAQLDAGKLRDAETSVRAALARGGDRVELHCDFLAGNIAFADCALAERQAETAASEPFAFDLAIEIAIKAGRLWTRAAMARDWPAARRNAERALLKIDALRRKKRDAEQRQNKKTDPEPKPQPKPKPKPQPKPPQGEEQDPEQAQLKELDPAQVLALLEKLARKEREKITMRRTDRKARMAEVERDW